MKFSDTFWRRGGSPARDGQVSSSLDAGTVQRMFGGDLSLLSSVVTGMLREYADLGGTRDSLRARMHKLKGIAGMIGATAVMRLASVTEEILEKDHPDERLEEALRQLTSALTALGKEVPTPLATQPEPVTEEHVRMAR